MATMYRAVRWPLPWAMAACLTAAHAGNWQPLAEDDLHDPAGPAIGLLQEPADALAPLPPDSTGNQVRWVRALREGHIQPRRKLDPTRETPELDKDILLNLRGGMPVVRFPHKAHTEWLDCSNCHDHLFKRKTGATGISMYRILQGEQCGVCHGAVSFPLTECNRCHSVSHKAARQELDAAAQARTPAR